MKIEVEVDQEIAQLLATRCAHLRIGRDRTINGLMRSFVNGHITTLHLAQMVDQHDEDQAVFAAGALIEARARNKILPGDVAMPSQVRKLSTNPESMM